MKIRPLFTIALLFSTISSYAQVSENFDKTSLSLGSLACWESDYASETAGTSRIAATAAQSLSTDSRLSLVTTSPVEGTTSLRVDESITVPVHQGGTSTVTLYSPAYGNDNDQVSLKVRVNSANDVSSHPLYIMISCGAYTDYRRITSGDIGNVIDVTRTITSSAGGGVIKIEVWYSQYTNLQTVQTYAYSIDIDAFSTTANVDPSNTCAVTLPVTLASFSARKSENLVILDWVTAAETNSDRFEIQRSADTKAWEVMGTVPSTAEASGQHLYQFTDAAPLAGINYYRLKMIDKDGSFAFSRIRDVGFGATGLKLIAYPNPATDKLFVQNSNGDNLSASQVRQISIVSTSGAMIHNVTAPTNGIDLKGVAPGLYVLIAKFADGTQSTSKFIVKK